MFILPHACPNYTKSVPVQITTMAHTRPSVLHSVHILT